MVVMLHQARTKNGGCADYGDGPEGASGCTIHAVSVISMGVRLKSRTVTRERYNQAMKRITCPICQTENVDALQPYGEGQPIPTTSCVHLRLFNAAAYVRDAVGDELRRRSAQRQSTLDPVPEEWFQDREEWLMDQLERHFSIIDGAVFGGIDGEKAFAAAVLEEYETTRPLLN
jgi:hypothetical protein